jgi:hypothetical protein
MGRFEPSENAREFWLLLQKGLDNFGHLLRWLALVVGDTTARNPPCR